MLSNKMLAKTPMKFAEIYFSPDRKQIVIIPAKENALKVKNNGYVRTDKASQYLEEAKIRMPAKYTSEWSEEDGAWICTYSGDYFPERAIKNTPMPKTAKKRNVQEWQYKF